MGALLITSQDLLHLTFTPHIRALYTTALGSPNTLGLPKWRPITLIQLLSPIWVNCLEFTQIESHKLHDIVSSLSWIGILGSWRNLILLYTKHSHSKLVTINVYIKIHLSKYIIITQNANIYGKFIIKNLKYNNNLIVTFYPLYCLLHAYLLLNGNKWFV